MYNIKSLNPRHFQILDMHLRGWPNVAIAARLEMTPEAISLIVNSNSFKHEAALERSKINAIRNENIALEASELRGDGLESVSSVKTQAKEKLERATLAAVEALVANVASDDEAIANRASAEILDRAGGFQKITRNENLNQSITISISDAVASRLAEALEKSAEKAVS
jgi:hypothetical protein